MNKFNLKICLFLLIFSFSKLIYSQQNEQFLKTELKNKLVNTSEEKVRKFKKSEFRIDNQQAADKKSPFIGAGLSILIPGAGEIYAKSYIKGAIFLLAEGGLWLMNRTFDKKGDDQTTSFQNFAKEKWDVRKYAFWLKREAFAGSAEINPDEPDLNILRSQINNCESQNFSHTMPNYGEQQFYEVIGKYKSFIAGWDDADLSVLNKNNYLDFNTNHFSSYGIDRQQANNYYNKADLALYIIVLNHLLSAADGAWSVSIFNKKMDLKSSIDIKTMKSLSTGELYYMPNARLSLSF